MKKRVGAFIYFGLLIVILLIGFALAKSDKKKNEANSIKNTAVVNEVIQNQVDNEE